MEPTTFGIQINRSCCHHSTPGCMASNVLKLNSTVPANCSAQLSQPASSGCQPNQTRPDPPAASGFAIGPALAAWNTCR